MSDATLSFVHRYVPATQPDAPVLLLLHGTGGDENDLLPLGRLLLPGAGLLSPRGQVLENGMPRFFRRFAEGIFDLEDLQRRTQDLADFVRAAAIAYRFDSRRVVAAGYSNGANIAANLLLADPDVLAGAVLFHALLPREPETQPQLRGIPIFLSGGHADPLIPVEATERLAALLREAGAAVTLHWERGGHRLAESEAIAARDWLAGLAL